MHIDIMTLRNIQPEILDTLPADHPDALASRRDLHKINFVMGNFRWLRKMLFLHLRDGEKIMELGSGDGRLGDFLHRTMENDYVMTGLDRCPRPNRWPIEWPWICDDIFYWTGGSRPDVLIANLFLHHFREDQLQELGRRLFSHARMILACEPARYWLPHLQLELLRLTGIHPVTRHDGHISIDAGFMGDELPASLGLNKLDWNIETGVTYCGAYRMAAIRR